MLQSYMKSDWDKLGMWNILKKILRDDSIPNNFYRVSKQRVGP